MIGICLVIALGILVWRVFIDKPGSKEPREPEVVNVPESEQPGGATGAISVFFSRCYDNDPKAAQRDERNIDRECEKLIGSAKRSIDAALFEIESERIAGALVAAHRRGVRVRIVSDSDYRENPEMVQVVDAGIPVVFDERSALMHNKFLVVDDRTVWAGSWNATDNCSWRNNNNAVMVESKELATNYATEFREMFESRRFGPTSPARTPHPLVTAGGSRIETLFAPEDRVAAKLVGIIGGAKRSIHVMAFSFTEPTIADAMIARARAGVRVEGVVETRGSDAGQMNRLNDGGARIVRDGNRYVLHHKVIIVDSATVILGSYNFTGSAERSNDENVLIIRNRSVALRFEEEYTRVRRMAAQVTS